MPGPRLFTDQLSSPDLTTSDNDEIADQVLAKVRARVAVRKSRFGSPMPPTAKRRVDKDRASSPMQGLGQSFNKLDGMINAETFPIEEDSLRSSSRRSVIPFLSVPPSQLLSRF